MDVKQLLVGLALVAAACGGATSTESAPESETTDGAPAATTASTAATAPQGQSESSDSTAAAADGRQRPEGPDAPDFTLPLGQGYDFVLSAEAKPVYMVFWAEW